MAIGTIPIFSRSNSKSSLLQSLLFSCFNYWNSEIRSDLPVFIRCHLLLQVFFQFFPSCIHHFPWFAMVFHGFSWFSMGFPWVFHHFSIIFPAILGGFPGHVRWASQATCSRSRADAQGTPPGIWRGILAKCWGFFGHPTSIHWMVWW